MLTGNERIQEVQSGGHCAEKPSQIISCRASVGCVRHFKCKELISVQCVGICSG